MGGRGGSSGLSGGSSFPKISLQGKTGTEKQRQYAENLIESARLTAKANGVAGIIKQKEGPDRFVPKDDAEAIRAAYKLLSASAGTRKTYGEVIDLFKRTDVLSLSKDLKAMANKAGKSVTEYVNEGIRDAKKKKGR